MIYLLTGSGDIFRTFIDIDCMPLFTRFSRQYQMTQPTRSRCIHREDYYITALETHFLRPNYLLYDCSIDVSVLNAITAAYYISQCG